MSENLQFGAITYGVERNAIRIIASGKMQMGTKQMGEEDFVCMSTHDGLLNKDGRIIENANENENVKGR